jgi:hypothetical protein
MDGLWNAASSQEPTRQAGLVRHRILTFNLDPGGALNDFDASSYGSVDPNSITPTSSSRGLEGGPHFVLSPQSPDGRPTLGFEWALTNLGLSGFAATPGEDGFTVTIWVMLGVSMSPDGTDRPDWAAFEPITGVDYRQMYHSFDTNASVIRFQISNYAEPVEPNENSVGIAFAEL